MKHLKCQQFNNHADKTTLDTVSRDKHDITLPAIISKMLMDSDMSPLLDRKYTFMLLNYSFLLLTEY